MGVGSKWELAPGWVPFLERIPTNGYIIERERYEHSCITSRSRAGTTWPGRDPDFATILDVIVLRFLGVHLSTDLPTIASQSHMRITNVDAAPLVTTSMSPWLRSNGSCFDGADAGLGQINLFHLTN